jgi:glycine cleavage system aminomethyltransferase T
MSNQSTAQTSLAKTHCILTRDDIAEVPTFRLLIGREYGEFVWNTVLDAGKEFGIVAVGIEALKKSNS